jgi:magnesium-transporting ATPase (P-type)
VDEARYAYHAITQKVFSSFFFEYSSLLHFCSNSQLIGKRSLALHELPRVTERLSTVNAHALPHINMENAFAKSTSEVLKFFSVSETQGLTEAQVKESRDKHGRNGRQLYCCAINRQRLTSNSNRRRSPNALVGTDPRAI